MKKQQNFQIHLEFKSIAETASPYACGTRRCDWEIAYCKS